MLKNLYEVTRNQPVARFYYQGSHSHPVRRTILVIESTPTLLTGYELREGSVVREFRNAPIKSFRRESIATEDQLGPCKHRERGRPTVSTLQRESLRELVLVGA
jgi:hypothetical protein